MSRRGRNLLHVLAVLLLVQWVAGLQPCLRVMASLASVQAIELCSPGSEHRTILVGRDGKEVPAPKPHPGCPLCQHVTPALLPAVSVVPLPPATFVALVAPSTRQGLPPAPPRGPPQQPRAPPIA